MSAHSSLWQRSLLAFPLFLGAALVLVGGGYRPAAEPAPLPAAHPAPLPAPRLAQDAEAEVQIEVVPVSGHVSMLVGQGGNIGLSVGEDGAFLIDDQFAPLTPRILAAVAGLTDQPVRWPVNTHWHGDHTGGNENIGQLGTVIVAHENVRKRMSVEQVMEAFGRTVPPSPEIALPRLTFTEGVTFHWNGDTVEVFHVAPAHTDGDAIIRFHGANVIHMGDVFFNGLYPFIDAGSGGSIDGVIAAVDRVLPMCDEHTRIIPGHGPLAGRTELLAYRTMLVTVRDRLSALLAKGKSKEEIVAARPTADLDATWGNGFLEPDNWVGIVLGGMQAPR